MKFLEFLKFSKLNEQEEESGKKWLSIDDYNKLSGLGYGDDGFDIRYDNDGDDGIEFDDKLDDRFDGVEDSLSNSLSLKDEITKKDIDEVLNDIPIKERPNLSEEEYEKIISDYREGVDRYRADRWTLGDIIEVYLDSLNWDKNWKDIF